MGSIVLLLVAGFVVFTAAMARLWFNAWRNNRADDLLVDLDQEAKELADLARTKTRALQDIRDLEFDFRLGHLSEEDYDALRQKLERQAISAMKRLDRLRGSTDYDALIDRGYAARFGVAPAEAPGSNAPPGDAPEQPAPEAPPKPAQPPAPRPAPAAAPPPQAAPAPTRPCPACARLMGVDAAFCSGCGASLPPLEPPAPTTCAGCGAELDADARFCKACGAPVAAASANLAAPPSTTEVGS